MGATKKLLIVNKFQKKRHQCRYWNKFLEAQKKKVDYLNKIFRQSKSHEDYRMLKHAKNRLTKFTKICKKEYYKKKYNTNLGKWKELKIEEGNENKTLVSAHINNKVECSPKTLANEFSKTLLDKIQEIKSELPVNDIIAEKIYKDLVPRNENDIKLKEVTIKEIYEIINKSRPTKLRGNNEVNMYILKQIPQLSAIALTHIINTIIRTGIFPDCMKISRVIPILKPKKDKNLLRLYRPINNMNVIEKVIEQVLKKQLTKFIEDNNILDKYMHGSRPKHSIITAKMEFDEEINLHKDKGNKVAILSTDLSSAYDTVNHRLLLSILENIGIRGKFYNLIESYLKDRKFYTEVQGHNGDLKNMPEVSVIQGSKLSSLFYSLFTIDTLRYNVLMEDKKIYKQLTGRNMKKHNIISHKIITYVDDTQPIIAAETNEDLKNYIQDLHELLIAIYKHKSLYINGDKTEFLNFDKPENEGANFIITDEKKNIIKQKKSIKILGYRINRNNNLANHISGLVSKINFTYNKIKGVLPYMNKKNRKIVIDAKIRLLFLL